MATDDTTVLDAREIDGPPFGPIVSALEDLEAGETLRLVNGFEPVPLYDEVEARGLERETTKVADDEWHVEVTRP